MSAEYMVLFTNLTSCAMGISDIDWSVKVVAESEASAIELALTQARVLNREKGMPPHGIRLRAKDLRSLAIVYGVRYPPARRPPNNDAPQRTGRAERRQAPGRSLNADPVMRQGTQ